MSSDKYTFNASFQQKILSLLLRDDDFLLGYREVMKPYYFENPVHVDVSRVILDHFDKYRTLPDQSSLIELVETSIAKKLERAKKPEEIRTVYLKAVDDLFDCDFTDGEFVKDKVVEFAQHQALKEAILKSVDLLGEGKFQDIKTTIGAAMEVGQNANDLGTFYFDNIEERILNYNQEQLEGCVGTGSKELDAILGGGLSAKELGVIVAPPNVGKTLRLVNFGKAALFQKKWVFHYTLEMSEARVAQRYDACLTGRDIADVHENPRKIGMQLGKLKKIAGGNLVIKAFSTKTATINDIRSHLSMVKAKYGIVPGLILIDYPQIMRSVKPYNDRRHEVASCYEDCRALAQDEHCPVWGAIQTNRGALNKKIVTIEDLSEAFEVAAIVDVMVALCQTPEEYEDGMLREFGAKNRNGAKFWVLEKNVNYSTMQIMDA